MRIDQITVTATARMLASEDGENPEYDRALVEMSAYLLGLGSQYQDDPEGITRLVLGREQASR